MPYSDELLEDELDADEDSTGGLIGINMGTSSLDILRDRGTMAGR